MRMDIRIVRCFDLGGSQLRPRGWSWRERGVNQHEPVAAVTAVVRVIYNVPQDRRRCILKLIYIAAAFPLFALELHFSPACCAWHHHTIKHAHAGLLQIGV